VTMTGGSQPKMGSTVTRGEVEATVEFTGMQTFFGKTAAMIQSVEEMSHFQKILLKIMFFLLAVSFVLCGIILIYLLVSGETVLKAISYVVVLLVASIPLAMEVVTTTTMAIGSHQLAHKNAIVARLAAIEELAGMDMLCSDKTGTLTQNKMVIQEECPIYKDGMTMHDIILYAAMAAKWHEPPKDALDTLVLGQVNVKDLEGYEHVDYMPFDPIFKRTEGTVKAPNGEIYKTTKGAPHIIVKLQEGRPDVLEAVNHKVHELAERGIRSLAVARTYNGTEKWEMLGILTFLDPPRPGTKEVLARAKDFNIKVKMITGDHTAIAKETCRQLGLGTNILNADGLPSLEEGGKAPKDLYKIAPLIMEADGFAQVFPEHKFLIVEALRQQGFVVGMTGDGVNDAPALKKADIGIAVQGATDAARAAADIVLTNPGLGVIIDAITISRCIFQRIQNFVLYRVACTLQLLVFFFIAVLAFHPEDFATQANGNTPGSDTYLGPVLNANIRMATETDEWGSVWNNLGPSTVPINNLLGSNRDGTSIAWHAPECPYKSLFIQTNFSTFPAPSAATVAGTVMEPWKSMSWFTDDINNPGPVRWTPGYFLSQGPFVYKNLVFDGSSDPKDLDGFISASVAMQTPGLGATSNGWVLANCKSRTKLSGMPNMPNMSMNAYAYLNVSDPNACFQEAGYLFYNTSTAVPLPGYLITGNLCSERWNKYFNLPVIALIIITLLNDGTIISIAYDHVEPSRNPEAWNLPISYLISGTLGGVACASSIWLLALTLDSHNLNGTWYKGWGLPMLTYGDVVCALYQKVSLSDFLTLFSARTVGPFFSQIPAKPLLAAACFAMGCSTILAALWPFNEEKDTLINGFGTGSASEKRSRAGILGVVWLYVFIWWMVQDAAKVGLYMLMRRLNILHRKTTMSASASHDEEIQAQLAAEKVAKASAAGQAVDAVKIEPKAH